MDFYFVGVMFIILRGWIFMSKYKHMLIMLLSLETMMLGLYSLLYLAFLSLLEESMVLMIFLGFSVCEGSVGLGLLVMFVRSYGSDFFYQFIFLMMLIMFMLGLMLISFIVDWFVIFCFLMFLTFMLFLMGYSELSIWSSSFYFSFDSWSWSFTILSEWVSSLMLLASYVYQGKRVLLSWLVPKNFIA